MCQELFHNQVVEMMSSDDQQCSMGLFNLLAWTQALCLLPLEVNINAKCKQTDQWYPYLPCNVFYSMNIKLDLSINKINSQYRLSMGFIDGLPSEK